MPTTHTLVIGAGQAGLAVSRSLADADVDHVVLERGRVAERWRSHRWEALRLLTPNWATRLPGWSYQGPHPDGYMTATELAGYLTDYAGSFAAPVHEHSPVRSLEQAEGGYAVRTDDTRWRAANVVIATGWCDEPRVPAVAARLDRTIAQVTTSSYRNPDELPDGRVLVVGASATGVQLADELARAGRDVVLAVGRHSRLPRCYRGVDIWWWLDQIGTFARTIDQVSDPARSRREGSVQLAGRADHRDVDLPALQRLGVRLAGRLVGVDGARVGFADDLPVTTAAADGAARADPPPGRRSHPCPRAGRRGAAARRRGVRSTSPIGSTSWTSATSRSAPSSGPPGSPGPTHGCTSPCSTSGARSPSAAASRPHAGLYVLGQRFQHRGDSNFIDGVRHDAAHVARHIASRLQSHEPIAS